MAHPKRKTSKARRDKRRSHLSLDSMNLVKCDNCDALHRRHHVCMSCGYYKGSAVINMDSSR
ncbi:MAG: 50S ribosomal protein L32 [Bacteroidetes bacterium]|nr:50S ribosomal protein L32 [Bacteroidota bacterium]PTM15855.1 MAG: 50S ribosomal protein L32 [Bacteroidota bacterium]PTM20260.1 MAG: 50S ribosomal protein L32 [Bacteroidota bacterium]